MWDGEASFPRKAHLCHRAYPQLARIVRVLSAGRWRVRVVAAVAVTVAVRWATLLRQASPVHDERLPGHVVRGLRSQEQHRSAYLLGRGDPPHWDERVEQRDGAGVVVGAATDSRVIEARYYSSGLLSAVWLGRGGRESCLVVVPSGACLVFAAPL